MLLLLVLLVAMGARSQQQEPMPNVVLVMADSVGRGDLLTIGERMGYSTPHISKLSGLDGAILTRYYVQSESSPTRAALLTGRFPFNLGLQRQLVPGTTAAVPVEVPTLAEMLQAVGGYTSHMIGAWDLGYARLENTPTSRGYQTFYGHLGPWVDPANKTLGGGFDFWDEVRGQTFFRKPARDEAVVHPQQHAIKQYQARTRRIIQDHVAADSGAPFFLTVAHPPPQQSGLREDARCAKSSPQRREYCAGMLALDDAMGDLRQVLEEQRIWGKTIIVFTTTSGAMVPVRGFVNNTVLPKFPGNVGSNFPLRGSKLTLFEGGLAGTAFVSGGALPPQFKGRTLDQLAHAVDLPVMILELLQPLGRFRARLDGESPLVARQHGEEEMPLHVEFGGLSYSAVRFGKYKLIAGFATRLGLGDGYWRSDGKGQLAPAPPRKRLAWYQLFDLEADPLERVNLVRNQTALVRLGQRKLLAWAREALFKEPMPNAPHPLSLPALHNHVWAPFLPNHPTSTTTDGIVPR